jgi:hypothetical protein
MIINASPCLKYSRPRLATKRPTQQRVQISPFISRILLRFIRRHDHQNLAGLKQLNDRGHAAPVVCRPLDDLFRPTDAVSFTPNNLPIENRCLKIPVGKKVVGQLIFCVNRKEIFSLSYQRSDFIEYTRIHYTRFMRAPIGKPNSRLIKCPSCLESSRAQRDLKDKQRANHDPV